MASAQNGSRDPIDPQCDPCRFEGQEETAEGFCCDCLEYLCPVCCHFHQKFSATRAHTIVQQKELDNQPRFTIDGAATRFQTNLKGGKQTSRSSTASSRHLVPMGMFSAQLPDDMNVPMISGCTYLQGTILIVDQANRKVKLFDSHYSYVNQLKLQGKPADITTIRSHMVALTIPSQRTILFVSSPNLSVCNNIPTLRRCWAIDFNNDELYVVTGEKEDTLVYIFNLSGEALTFIQPLELVFSCPRYISVSHTGGTIYITDSNNCVVALGMDGRIIFQFSSPDVISLQGITSDARAVYVACETGLISLDLAGTSYCKLLEDSDELQCVCQSSDQKQLLVAKKGLGELAEYSKE